MNEGHSSKVLFKRNDCGLKGVDYGIVEKDGSKTGGVTCSDFRPYYESPIVVGNPIFGEKCEINGCESKIVKLKIGTTLMMKNFGIDYYVVEIGFTFSDGHVTTKTEHYALNEHEKGHVEDAKCIAQKFPNEGEYIEVEIEAYNEKTALDNATIRYHKKYNTYGYPKEKYVCPNDL